MRQQLATRILTFLLAGACAVGLVSAQNRLALAPGDAAPDMRGRTAELERIVVDFSASKFTLINFWAIWCEPCRDEMPALQRLYTEHDGLQVIGVLMDPSGNEALAEFLDGVGVTYPVIRPDPAVNMGWGGIGVMPTTFLVDETGRIARRYVGATAEQIDGLVVDVVAVLEGRPLGNMVIPETPNVATEEDRMKIVNAERGDEVKSPNRSDSD